MSILSRRKAVLLVASVLTLQFGAHAQAADSVDVAAAKKEGKVVWYTSTPIATATKISKQFEADTGIHVEMFRSGGSAILRRFMQELQGGQSQTDVLTTSDPAASMALAKKGVFVPFKPANFEKVPETARDPNGAWVAQRLNMIAIVARKDKVSAADMPKTWSDLVDPKFKGKLVTTDPSFTSLGLMTVATLSKKLTWDFYKKLRANEMMVVPGNQQVSDMLKSGERLVAAGILDSYAAADRKKGHPLLTIYPSEGALIIPSPTAIIKGSPHPNAAKMFAQYMLSDAAQKLFPADGGYAARVDISPPADAPKLADVKSIPIDYQGVQKDTARVKREFNEIFQ